MACIAQLAFAECSRLWCINPGGQSGVWIQLAADMQGLPAVSLARDPGAALAAAFVAGMGAGVFRSWNEIDPFVALWSVAQPDGKTRAEPALVSNLTGTIHPD